MHISWSVKDMPELAPLSENDKQVIMYETSLAAFRHWQTWVGVVIVYICGSVGGHFADVAGAAVGGGIGGCVLAPIVLRMQALEIRQRLAIRQNTPAVEQRAARDALRAPSRP